MHKPARIRAGLFVQKESFAILRIYLSSMTQTFEKLFNKLPTLTSEAPGRINLIGEHTDYNEGFVMPGAIDKKITFYFALNGSDFLCRFYSRDTGESVELNLDELMSIKDGNWRNYLIGVLAETQQAGYKLGGFDAIFGGDIPLGAGLSSSAALECALAAGINELFSLGLSPVEMARFSQAAEHNFVGVKCGIMDQFASVMGKEKHVFRLDCRSLKYEYFPLELGAYSLLLCDTKVQHSLDDSDYNTRRKQCEEGVRVIATSYPGIQHLRDVNKQILEASEDKLSGCYLSPLSACGGGKSSHPGGRRCLDE